MTQPNKRKAKKAKLHVLQHLSQVAAQLEDCQLTKQKLSSMAPLLKPLQGYFKLSIDQCVLLTVIYSLNYTRNRAVDLDEISKYLDLSPLNLLLYKKDLDFMIDNGYLVAERGRSNIRLAMANNRFSVSEAVSNAVLENEQLGDLTKGEEMDIFEFAKTIWHLSESRDNDQINTNELFEETNRLIESHKHLPLVKHIHRLNFNNVELVLYFEMCHDWILYGRTGLDCTIDNILDRTSMRIKYKKIFSNEESELFQKGLISIEKGKFINETLLYLTEKSVDMFVGKDAHIFQKKQDKNSKLIAADTIVAKELFFHEEMEQKINFLRDSIYESNLTKLRRRLSEKQMSPGITAIFYGPPGTGKTESIFQMAKQTGRDVMHVDISESKSMWFGESEKCIKQIFKSYNMMLQKCKKTPILLFNEADAILGSRGAAGKSSTDQTLNAMQNILLEELEKFEGILMATTNFHSNLDKAFDRRFLFKILFDKPSVESRKKIWKSKISSLTASQCEVLASNFNFSGGQIDNIARKCIMQHVLHGTKVKLEELIAYCKSEAFQGDVSKVGFKMQ